MKVSVDSLVFLCTEIHSTCYHRPIAQSAPTPVCLDRYFFGKRKAMAVAAVSDERKEDEQEEDDDGLAGARDAGPVWEGGSPLWMRRQAGDSAQVRGIRLGDIVRERQRT